MKRLNAVVVIISVLTIFTGCSSNNNTESMEENKPTYTYITQEEALEMMSYDDGHFVVDVRTREEFNQGHIPNAFCIPNEEIGTEMPKELPGLDQVILVYCRTGRRSAEAAQKLADVGYTRVYDFGGIVDWDGDIVSG